MQLQRHFEDNHSWKNKLKRIFETKKHRNESLGQLLKYRRMDFECENGRFVEKKNLYKEADLYHNQLQRSQYIKFDDNLLNLKAFDSKLGHQKRKAISVEKIEQYKREL